MNCGKIAECLKTKYGTHTVEDVESLAEAIHNTNHLESDECECITLVVC